MTFEKLIGKEQDSFPFPDFYNLIEIKTKLAYSKTPISLFKLTPNGNSFIETKRIYENYGYYRTNDKLFKVFNGTIYANKLSRIGFNYFSLDINYIEKKIKILVYNQQFKIIDYSIFWNFNELENALMRKINYLAVVLVWKTTNNGNKYYKYFKYNIYKLIDFNTFLKLLSQGIIGITFSIDVYKNEKRYGQIHDHGTSFNIHKENIEKLFIRII